MKANASNLRSSVVIKLCDTALGIFVLAHTTSFKPIAVGVALTALCIASAVQRTVLTLKFKKLKRIVRFLSWLENHERKTRQAHVWRTDAQAYDREYLLQTVKQRGESVTIWAAVSGFSAGLIVILKGRIAGEKYREILADQVNHMMEILLPAGDGIFQDDNVPINATGLVQSQFNEHEEEVKHLPWLVQHPTLM
ncbi:DDE_3 domain-containing protein [Trichonephila clavipes]|uniref:DDE_3 domain-containing protein n=1 Tax=Trichonephila clavipes TaxID=2585209 RepID=A0A8X6VY99_TRICX|nr:DDE_3 domain-containing protein [Trichonephila clavipes]